jgi:P27 family predicted phage terminase small subunit
MAKTGRPRKPSIIKFNAGERRKERLNPDEPKPDLCIPIAPEHLKGEALAEWNRISVELDRLSLLSECDRSALAAYCSAWARYVQAEKDIEINGSVTITEKGNIIQSPHVGISNQALLVMHRYLVEFGLSPASRTRVTAPRKDDPKNKWANLASPDTKKAING